MVPNLCCWRMNMQPAPRARQPAALLACRKRERQTSEWTLVADRHLRELCQQLYHAAPEDWQPFGVDHRSTLSSPFLFGHRLVADDVLAQHVLELLAVAPMLGISVLSQKMHAVTSERPRRPRRCCIQSPVPGLGEKYCNFSGFPSHSFQSAGGAFLTIIFGQIFAYSAFNDTHFSNPGSVSALIALTGHSGSQTPQSMHSSGWMTSMFSPS